MMSRLSTPVVVVDLDIAERNMANMAGEIKKAGVKHRPHIKTHKSVYFARKQLEAGGTGITCAKLGEAEIMAQAGFDDILIAFPIIGTDKQERLYRLAQSIKVITCADSIEGARSISEVGVRLGKKLPLYIEVDGGIHRCGRQPGQDTLQFAQQIKELPGIEIIGLLSYAGQIYGEDSREHMQQIAVEEAETLARSAELLRNSGIPIQEVSVGSSISSKFVKDMSGITELRAGNYVFHDVGQLSTGMVTVNDCALRVIVTVVSVPAQGSAIIDAGSKTLTSDTMPFSKGYGFVIEHPEIEIYKLNEEHGFLRFDPSLSLEVGQRLTIIPNHACVIPNLCDTLVGVRSGNVVETIAVEARGKNN
jgi:D-serine deaminase-like pyridoxal phosphate-dependent protein